MRLTAQAARNSGSRLGVDEAQSVPTASPVGPAQARAQGRRLPPGANILVPASCGQRNHTVAMLLPMTHSLVSDTCDWETHAWYKRCAV